MVISFIVEAFGSRSRPLRNAGSAAGTQMLTAIARVRGRAGVRGMPAGGLIKFEVAICPAAQTEAHRPIHPAVNIT